MLYYLYYFFRYLFRTIDFILITLVALLCSLLPHFAIKGFFPRLYRFWSLSFVRWFGVIEHIHQYNDKEIPKQYILISNHPTGIDVIWLPGRFNVFPLSKDQISRWFVVGKITREAGVIFVKRESASSRHASLRAMMDAIDEKKNLLIFPEGGCYGKLINPFKDGAFRVSMAKNIPILPVYLHYEEENTYEWGDIGALPYIIRLLTAPKSRHAHMYIFDAIEPGRFKDVNEYRKFMSDFYLDKQQKIRNI